MNKLLIGRMTITIMALYLLLTNQMTDMLIAMYLVAFFTLLGFDYRNKLRGE